MDKTISRLTNVKTVLSLSNKLLPPVKWAITQKLMAGKPGLIVITGTARSSIFRLSSGGEVMPNNGLPFRGRRRGFFESQGFRFRLGETANLRTIGSATPNRLGHNDFHEPDRH